jgi:adenylate kinase
MSGRGKGGWRLVLFGAPGVGKGTQSQAIRARLGLVHVATGDMLRAAMEAGTGPGLQAKAIVDRGGLVPDTLVGAMMAERLSQPDVAGGFLLDGFPRTAAQADLLDGWLAGRGQHLDRVINIVVPEPEILDRLTGRRICGSCGASYNVRDLRPRVAGRCDICGDVLRERADDTRKAIARRLEVYKEETAPLVDRYARAGVLLTVDGRGRPDEVTQRILDGLEERGR